MYYELKNKENTLKWYEEYISTKDFDRLPTNLIEEDLDKIKNRSVVFFAENEGVSAVVLSYKKGAACVIVPISEYNYPSTEFEVYLPKSKLVLQTWNARVCVPSKLKEFAVIAKVSEEDMYIALSHYNAVFENIDFKFPTLIGDSLAEIEEELALCLDKYLHKEAIALPESQFVVMPQDLSLELEEYKESDLENIEEEFLQMPNTINSFNPYGLAATPPEDTAEDNTNPENKK